MNARKQVVEEEPGSPETALRDLVRLLARQAAAEFVRDRLQDGAEHR